MTRRGYVSGHCHAGRHQPTQDQLWTTPAPPCAGRYAGVDCTCNCHPTAPRPDPETNINLPRDAA